MKKFKTYTGGHPFANDDLMFLQSAYEQGINAITTLYGNNFVLSGFERSNVNITIPGVGTVPGYRFTAGWVVIDGELLKFAQQDIFASDYTTARLVMNEEALGPLVNYGDDLITHQIYYERKAFIVPGVTTGNLDAFGAAKFGTYSFHEVGQSGEPAYQSNWGAATPTAKPVKFRFNSGHLEINGWANNGYGIGPAGPVIFILPIEFRPAHVFTSIVPIWDGSTRSFAVLTIDTSGNVSVSSATTGGLTEYNVSLDNLRISLS